MKVRFDGRSLDLLQGESVLDCMDRHGVPVASACRSGVCQTCMLRVTAGEVPPAAQVGLSAMARQQGYFLACMCRPKADMTLAPTDARAIDTTVVRTERLADGVVGVWLETPAGFEYRPGQFVHIVRKTDGLTRPYSIASGPGRGRLELHVAVLSFGRMSRWLATSAGKVVALKGPFGSCFYPDLDRDEPLVLAGTGTGLAPLLGVLRDALAHGHRGPMQLYHGGRTSDRLYAHEALDALERTHENVTVTRSLLESAHGPSDGTVVRPMQELIVDEASRRSGARYYLAGAPGFVQGLKKRLYLAGSPLDRIHADPFVEAPAPTAVRATGDGRARSIG